MQCERGANCIVKVKSSIWYVGGVDVVCVA